MKAKEFVSKLLNIFSRDTVIEDLRFLRGDFDKLQASYNFAADLARNWKFKDKTNAQMVGRFRSTVNGSDNNNPIVHIANHIKVIQKNLTTIEQLVTSNLGGQIAASGLTYRQSVILQYLQGLSLVAKYSRKWLNYMFTLESAQYKDYSLAVEESFTKAEVAWMDRTFGDFLIAYKAAICDPAKTLKQIAEVPDVTINDSNEDNLISTAGLTKVDPFQMNLVATKMNPFYFVKMLIADWQVNNYNEAKEEYRQIEQRIQLYRELQSNRPNAKLEKSIQQSESRLQSLQAIIAEMES